jgi:hypothetical protein
MPSVAPGDFLKTLPMEINSNIQEPDPNTFLISIL